MPASRRYPINESPLYKIRSRRTLAAVLFSSLPKLEALANQTDNYRRFDVVYAGKKRSVELPKPALARLHRRIFQILDYIEKPDYLHSGCKQRSYITNAQVHVGSVPLVKLDIKKFYASVSSAHVYRFFHGGLQCGPDVSGLLARLCTANGHLPIGSSASQLLAFFSAKPMFDELHRHSIRHEVRDSYYVDDLTWSGVNATPRFLWAAKQIVHRHGFKYHGDRVYTASQPKVVTGVLIAGDRIAVQPRRELELWNTINTLSMLDPAERLETINSLIGKAAANAQIDERFLARVRQLRAYKIKMRL
ncbi:MULTISPECIES: reverse transcriptase family protein [unclassified Variovorax]|uniref:reverse transcriptase family protein n=1 Tax=unclassified Variovorax TaxID=663243 RepID=UPI000F7E8B06|nr:MULTISPECIES: reverse transcriptase family protein [unclassified Variovorax]RSZ31862.1 RNA-directed DNA polymerase [Variovorax sp. 553]RSZ32128.1 RNA-directed DNA polymerase [Variovorax sp. 679]